LPTVRTGAACLGCRSRRAITVLPDAPGVCRVLVWAPDGSILWPNPRGLCSMSAPWPTFPPV
jgi:hypothetical protein